MDISKSFIILTALILTLGAATAQQVSPMIRGNVNISVKKGTIACDFILTDLPNIKNYVIRLNSGMNIHYFRDLNRNDGALYYDMDTKDSIQSDETKAYYLHENRGNPARYIPKKLEVKYLGMYPVVPDSASGYMGQDWRGNVAFNGYSIRAEGIQGAWYPVLYDMDKKEKYNVYKYDVNITCDDCSILFINGSKPARAKQANFVSSAPYEMSIFCGDFEAAENKGIWLLNPGMKKEDQQKLFGIANSYQAYYAKKFEIPFKGSLTFVQTKPVADPKYWAFAFYSSPTTFNVGIGDYGLQSLFDAAHSAHSKQSMAHELAHYYFGTLLETKGEFGHVIDEGFAEFLSYKLTKEMEGEGNYETLLKNKIKALAYLRNYKPLSLVKTENDYGNREYYLYYYVPVLLIAIDKEVGEQVMWKWLKAMVNAHPEVTGYNFLLTTFNSVVPDKNLREKIRTKYFTSENALENAKAELGEN